MVALVLGAALVPPATAAAAGRSRWRSAPALLRPEAWPFLGLYALFLLYEDRTRLTWLAGGLATLPVLWLGARVLGLGQRVPRLGPRAEPALGQPRLRRQPRARGDSRTRSALAPGARRRVRGRRGRRARRVRRASRRPRPTARACPTAARALAVLVLAALAAAWIALVAVMTVRGFSGNAALPHRPRGAAHRPRRRRRGVGAPARLAGRACRSPPRSSPRVALGALFVAARRRPARPDAARASSTRPTSTTTSARSIDDAGGDEHLRAAATRTPGRSSSRRSPGGWTSTASDVDLRPRGEPARRSSTSATPPRGWVAPPYTARAAEPARPRAATGR